MMAVGATIGVTIMRSSAKAPAPRPRLLISKTDPFTGLALLRTRYQLGLRPSDDMEGWALSWQLTGDKTFAEKALNAMRTNQLAKGVRPSRSWVDYARWSLAFDWLFDYPEFEQRLRDRIATELMDGAATMLASEDFARLRAGIRQPGLIRCGFCTQSRRNSGPLGFTPDASVCRLIRCVRSGA